MIRLIRLLVIIAPLVGGGPLAGRAQESTPAANLVSVPAACDVEPRSVAEIIFLIPETVATAERGGPIGHPEDATSVPMPPGEPADAETIAAITTTLGQVLACYNAGDRLRSLSLYSDRFIAEVYSTGVIILELEEWLAVAATPVPDRDRIEAFAVTNVVALADGRVTATVVVGDDEPVLVYFVEQDGRWLIDGRPGD